MRSHLYILCLLWFCIATGCIEVPEKARRPFTPVTPDKDMGQDMKLDMSGDLSDMDTKDAPLDFSKECPLPDMPQSCILNFDQVKDDKVRLALQNTVAGINTCDSCVPYKCADGFFDFNNNLFDGCECKTDETSAIDADDDNCDGFSYNKDRIIFVDPQSGTLMVEDRENSGKDPKFPLPDLKTAIERIKSDTSDNYPNTIFISEGEHVGNINFDRAVSIYGGFELVAENDTVTWQSDDSKTATIRGEETQYGTPTITLTYNNHPVRLHNLTIYAPPLQALAEPGTTSTTILVKDFPKDTLFLEKITIHAGQGKDGADGANGTNGPDGNDGTEGTNNNPGTGGTSVCGAAGGNGGEKRTCSTGNDFGAPGQNGYFNGLNEQGGTRGGQGGGGGRNDCEDNNLDCDHGDDATSGDNGLDGVIGALAPAVAPNSPGTFEPNGAWTPPTPSTQAQPGISGRGGGGGGAGGHGGESGDSSGHGGGGGSGGCGGQAGKHGQPGGASVAIVMINSFINATTTTINLGQGGAGGQGGVGGLGGQGGDGKNGGPGGGDCFGRKRHRPGASGGNGGDGGPGAPGNGGCGGSVFGIVSIGQNDLSDLDNQVRFVPTAQEAGQPGTGGQNPNGPKAPDGCTGVREDTFLSPTQTE